MIRIHYGAYDDIYNELRDRLLDDAPEVDVGEWHAQQVDQDFLVSKELRNVVFEMGMPHTRHDAVDLIEPNMPWAEQHFAERVGGKPLNPPPSHVNWPWASANEKHQTQGGGAFSHSYPERMWCAHMRNHAGSTRYPRGIRFNYGDLGDLVELLRRNPRTRQAYLPIWFPEDLMAAHQGERVPCTLGYHFLIREGLLHVTYPIRSCDFIRYFNDDVYLAVRLAQWVRDQLENKTGKLEYHVGTLTLLINSLHIFKGDISRLERERERKRQTVESQRALAGDS
jgi:hypothetical protein